jgi:hypothetical protein
MRVGGRLPLIYDECLLPLGKTAEKETKTQAVLLAKKS